MSDKTFHLELIQGVINRLASNSFSLKGWSVVLVSALLALGTKTDEPRLACFAILPSVMFWFLDGYFLAQERLFRGLYDHVRVQPGGESDFSMKTDPAGLSIERWASATFSITLAPFHLPIVAGAVLAAILLNLP